MIFYLSPKELNKIVTFSLADMYYTYWGSRQVFSGRLFWGYTQTPFQFSVDIKTSNDATKPVLDFAIVANHLNENTPEFNQFLKKFPSWTSVMDGTSTYESWIF